MSPIFFKAQYCMRMRWYGFAEVVDSNPVQIRKMTIKLIFSWLVVTEILATTVFTAAGQVAACSTQPHPPQSQ